MATGKIMETLENIHGQHINVLKFANHNPNLFCTSSFDKTIKMWDLRTRRTVRRPFSLLAPAAARPTDVCVVPAADL
jgi:WD40 repeat protein